ncbi:phasin family protein [Falsiroseomonas tokyonensis]|uniref:Phasin family protein n=1 Tax=Falsiroseomonas tokyonensis TaxID=430521 RepID=A0ABV7BVS9_9PROT|nr:phasin family protein [Falsiroseomonas tokyonensis]MBU8538589.1 phasin family protein [Falsiroseomonas tokyonensis]
MAAEPKAETKRGIALVANSQAAAAAAATQAATAATETPAAAKAAMDEGAAKARMTMEQGMQQMTKTTEGFYKAAEEAAEFGRGNLEAMTKATQMLTAGMQDLGKQYVAMSQAITEHAMESAKALSGVKSLKEAADIQAAFAKASLERTMSETAKLQEAAFRLAEQAGAPLAARMTLAVEKFSKPLAA